MKNVLSVNGLQDLGVKYVLLFFLFKLISFNLFIFLFVIFLMKFSALVIASTSQKVDPLFAFEMMHLHLMMNVMLMKSQ